ncbi:MAG: hypothetical protein ACRELB_03210, partial [Polyangiaceae bacterium]
MTSRVSAGLMSGKTSPLAAARQSPAMKLRKARGAVLGRRAGAGRGARRRGLVFTGEAITLDFLVEVGARHVE